MELEEIYKAYFQDVYRYIRRLSGSGQIAEEITSETFLKAVRAASGFRGECDFCVWLCQIAKNCAKEREKGERTARKERGEARQNAADGTKQSGRPIFRRPGFLCPGAKKADGAQGNAAKSASRGQREHVV